MRVRHDTAFISSILFTIALLCLIPSQYGNALSDPRNLTTTDPWARQVSRDFHWFGMAALATIAIGLTVIWTGYVKTSRSAWFIMFVFVWGWAFPWMVWPFDLRSITKPVDLVREAFKQPGLARGIVEELLIFVLMIIALLLPIKAFFSPRPRPIP